MWEEGRDERKKGAWSFKKSGRKEDSCEKDQKSWNEMSEGR